VRGIVVVVGFFLLGSAPLLVALAVSFISISPTAGAENEMRQVL
jgi:hypothetical protein